jgi:uncharacterized protein (TIGR02246 family)
LPDHAGENLRNHQWRRLMRTKLGFLSLAFLLLPAGLSGPARAQGASAADERAVRDIETRWENAWNTNDVPAMSRDFAPDADAVNLAGEWFKGRAPFTQSLTELHSDKAKGSIWQTEETSVKFLTPEIAIVHVLINSHGEHNPDGLLRPARRAILTRVEVKRGGQWLIVASQATNIVPRASALVPGSSIGTLGQ